MRTLLKNQSEHGWLTDTRPAQSQQNKRPQSRHLQVTSCQPVLSLLSSPQSSCLVNLRLISGSSAGTHRVLHRCKTPWCPFYSRCSQWTVNSEWSRLIPSPPRPPTPSNTTTTTTQPTLFTRYFFFFFSEALRISGQLPATVWRRIGGWWPYVRVWVRLNLGEEEKKSPTIWESQLLEEPLFQCVKCCAGEWRDGVVWIWPLERHAWTHTQGLSCCRVEKT